MDMGPRVRTLNQDGDTGLDAEYGDTNKIEMQINRKADSDSFVQLVLCLNRAQLVFVLCACKDGFGFV
jgi:hypothetical protein